MAGSSGAGEEISTRIDDSTVSHSDMARRTLLQGVIGQLILLLTIATLVVGVLLVWGGRYLTEESEDQELLLQFGTSLITFSVTTLLITIFATRNLERQLLSRVTAKLDDHVSTVAESMKVSTTDFQHRITQFVPLFGNCTNFGLDNVYLTRADALRDFGEHLSEELKEAGSSLVARMHPNREEKSTTIDSFPDRAKPRLWIVASSMKGVRETSVSKADGAGGFDGAGILTWAGSLAADGLLDLRILMTYPRYANLRASQERRIRGAIPQEINEALSFLQACRVPAGAIKLVRATPTVFAIATRTRMLLNPYPYSAEAFRSFTLTVRKAHVAPNDQHEAMHRDIFEQYEQRHFEVPWRQGMVLINGYEVPELDAATLEAINDVEPETDTAASSGPVQPPGAGSSAGDGVTG